MIVVVRYLSNKNYRRTVILHIGDEGIIQETEKQIGGVVTIDQCHPRTGNRAVGIISDCELSLDIGKTEAQRPGEGRKLRRVGRGLAAQVLIPDQIERGGRLERSVFQSLHEGDQLQNGGARLGTWGKKSQTL